MFSRKKLQSLNKCIAPHHSDVAQYTLETNATLVSGVGFQSQKLACVTSL